MFALICVHTSPGNPMALFCGNYEEMTDDSVQVDMSKRDSRQLTSAERKVICLFRLEKILEDLGLSLGDCNLKILCSQRDAMASIILKRQGYEPQARVKDRLERCQKLFNNEQDLFFNIVRTAMNCN
jgi:hypothetical protein